MTGESGTTRPGAVSARRPGLPDGVRLVRAGNPGPMTLDGTNTWVVDGPDGLLVVDPGPALAEHADEVVALTGGSAACVLLTHRHADHAEGAAALARALGAPVRATDPALCSPGAAALAPGEVVGGLEVLATPGHTSDSTCFLHRTAPGAPVDAVLTGDTVLGRGTTVVAHPDGRLDDYLDSLRALRDLAAQRDCPVLPGHGPVRPSLAAAAAAYLAHRQERLEAVRAAVAAGAATPRDVVEVVYADVPRDVWPAAEASVAAQLLHLGVPLVPGGAPAPSAGRPGGGGA